TRDPDLGKVVLYQLSYSRVTAFLPYFDGVVICISASLREAHYTRIRFTCNPLASTFFRFLFEWTLSRHTVH
ncbi:hypothetical protein VSX43_01675, partial [Klebsiella aerogenes]|uniref:hypothetical protein n=1 Tax=Klebsiella aerogenes TaxID=548 RepID=UPI002DDD8032